MKNRIILSLLAALLLLAMSVTLLAGCDFVDLTDATSSGSSSESLSFASAGSEQKSAKLSSQTVIEYPINKTGEIGLVSTIRIDLEELEKARQITMKYYFSVSGGPLCEEEEMQDHAASFKISLRDTTFFRDQYVFYQSDMIYADQIERDVNNPYRFCITQKITLPDELFTREKGGYLRIVCDIKNFEDVPNWVGDWPILNSNSSRAVPYAAIIPYEKEGDQIKILTEYIHGTGFGGDNSLKYSEEYLPLLDPADRVHDGYRERIELEQAYAAWAGRSVSNAELDTMRNYGWYDNAYIAQFLSDDPAYQEERTFEVPGGVHTILSGVVLVVLYEGKCYTIEEIAAQGYDILCERAWESFNLHYEERYHAMYDNAVEKYGLDYFSYWRDHPEEWYD